MAYYRIPLNAGVEHVQDTSGTLILVDGIAGAAGVDVTPIINGSRQVTMPGRKAGFKYRTTYDGVVLRADADCEVWIFLTTNDVSLGFTDGAQVNVLGSVSILNGTDERVPVDVAGGTVNVTATNVGINNNDAAAVPTRRQALATFVHVPAVAINTGAAQALVSDATLRRVCIRNASASASVAIGGAGVTLANAAIVLGPGDVWTDDESAGAAWFATSDQNGADVRVMGAKP